MKFHLIVCILTSIALVGTGCGNKAIPTAANTPATQQTMQKDELRPMLEAEYERVRLLTQESTPDAFFAAIDPKILSDQTRNEMRRGWSMAPQIMKDVMPPLKNSRVKFVKIVHNESWAGYYFAYKTEDGISMLAVRRFHLVEGSWRVADFSATSLSGHGYESLNATEIEDAITQSSIMGAMPPAKQ